MSHKFHEWTSQDLTQLEEERLKLKDCTLPPRPSKSSVNTTPLNPLIVPLKLKNENSS